MNEAPRLTTVRIGRLNLVAGDARDIWDARIVTDSDGAFRSVFAGSLSGPFSTLEQAVRHLEAPNPMPSNVTCYAEWREELTPLPDEAACPLCGAPVQVSPRYPRKLCPACVLEATDAQGRSVRFFNTGFGGGFTGRYVDDETPYPSHECFVRGIECRADEQHFGGIVVQRVAECGSVPPCPEA